LVEIELAQMPYLTGESLAGLRAGSPLRRVLMPHGMDSKVTAVVPRARARASRAELVAVLLQVLEACRQRGVAVAIRDNTEHVTYTLRCPCQRPCR
jgi:hypothetical protein